MVVIFVHVTRFPHPPLREGSRIFLKYPQKVSTEHDAARFRHHHRPVRILSELEAAKIALGYDEMDSIYEVEEVAFLERMPFFWVEMGGTSIWYHVGFTAIAKPISGDASPKRFFGELKFVEGEKKLVPTCCRIVETGDTACSQGCGFCPQQEKYLHPIGRYSCGAWEDPPPLEYTDESDPDGWEI